MPLHLQRRSEPALLERFHSAVRQSGYPYSGNGIILGSERGSVMHGASVGSDDRDYYAVYLEPPVVKLGLRPVEHHVWSTSDNTRKNTRDDIDLVMYSLTKFARLAAGGKSNHPAFPVCAQRARTESLVGLRRRPREQLSGPVSSAQIHRIR